MYYVGIIFEQNRYYFFTTLMHRKTAKRIYEPFISEMIENTDKDNLKKIINSYQTSKELNILKKKFSQSGRPPRKVVVPPEFIILKEDNISDIIDEQRVSKTKIILDEKNDENNDDIFTSKEKIVLYLKKIFEEKRIILEKFKSDFDLENELENIYSNSFDDLHPFIKAFGLAAASNESGKIKIKRY
ncbi:MAG: hypothetical protein H6680_02685 [Desulfobacteraceae bacterium]|nr:hypothetical protein [Desulfobacteraceae bacterium]